MVPNTWQIPPTISGSSRNGLDRFNFKLLGILTRWEWYPSAPRNRVLRVLLSQRRPALACFPL